MVKVLLLSNALAQLYNLICIQNAKYEIRIFMNIDENISTSSEMTNRIKSIEMYMYLYRTCPMPSIPYSVNFVLSNCWLCKISNLYIHEY